VSLLLLENITVVVGGGLLLWALHLPLIPGMGIFLCWQFSCACVLLAIDAVLSATLRDVVFKSWSVRIAQAKGGIPLSQVNSHLSQIDLASATASPLLVSAMNYAGLDRGILLAAIGTWHLASALLIGVLAAPLCTELSQLRGVGHPEDTNPQAASLLLNGFRAGFKMDIGAKCALVAFCFLFFSVLQPGGTTTTWLSTQGVSASYISAATAASQLCGFVGTSVTPYLIKRAGLTMAARITQLLQIVPLLIAASVLPAAGSPQPWNPLLFLSCLAFSRVGLWGFDLTERQIVQLATTESSRLSVFAVERAMSQALSLLMMMCSLWWSSAGDFNVLVAFSMAALSLSLCIFQFQACGCSVKTTRQG